MKLSMDRKTEGNNHFSWGKNTVCLNFFTVIEDREEMICDYVALLEQWLCSDMR